MTRPVETQGDEGLGALLDMLGVGLFRTAPAGRILHANGALVEILGFPSHEAILQADASTLWVDGEARSQLIARLEAEGFVRNVVVEMRRYDRSVIRARMSVRVLRDPSGGDVYEGVIEDVTDQQRAREHLAASERRFRSLVEHSWDGVALVDASARFIYISPSAERILGYTPEEMIGRSSQEFVYDELEARKRAFEDIVREPGKSVTAELRYRHREGSLRWLETVRTNLLDDPAVGAVVVNFRDVTEHHHAHEEERRARAAAEEANRAKDEFLATLSHELRSPLSAVLTWARLLRGGRLDTEKTERALETIERNARLQVRLIEDLLDVSRIAAGKLTLDIAPVELETTIQAAAEGFRAAVDSKRIRMSIATGREPLFVSGDAVRLQQVFGNLLSNAVKFTGEGGRVSIEARRIDSHAEVTVKDDGIGIESELLDRMFDRFHQSDSSLSRRHGGLGLGLAIVRHLVEAHGGTITAESEGRNRGATFRIWLPLDSSAQAAAVESSSTTDELPPSRDLESVRVLVVDDEDDALQFVSTVLVSAGAEVTTAHSSTEAAGVAAGVRPHVVVADLAMPEEDGFDLLQRLRGIEATTTVPVIALTALGGREYRERVAAAGFFAHLTKPIEERNLVAAVSNACRLRARVATPNATD